MNSAIVKTPLISYSYKCPLLFIFGILSAIPEPGERCPLAAEGQINYCASNQPPGDYVLDTSRTEPDARADDMFGCHYEALVLEVGSVAWSRVNVIACVAPSSFLAVIVVPAIENSATVAHI